METGKQRFFEFPCHPLKKMPYPIIRQLLSLTLLLFLFRPSSYGQKTEVNVNLYSGLFFFRGNGSTSNVSINPAGEYWMQPYPYGRASGFSYALEFQGQRITKANNLYGLGISAESLDSRVKNADLQIAGATGLSQTPGKATSRDDFITLNPFAGHRFILRRISLDVLAA
jgi:hypothetical protein